VASAVQIICTSLQHLITQFFTGRMLFMMPNQQYQSTEGNTSRLVRSITTTTTTTVLRPFFQDHLDEPVPEENFWTLWCKGD